MEACVRARGWALTTFPPGAPAWSICAPLPGLLLSLALTGCQGAPNSLNSPPASAAATATTPSVAVALTGTPAASVTVGNSYDFVPVVTQGSGTILFSIQGQPAWTSFDSTTGTLSGTPVSADVGLSGPITITASNGSSTASIGPFGIEVNAVEEAPPPSPPPSPPPPVTTGSATLSWTPPAANEDGSLLTNLAGYHVHYGTSSAALTQTIDVPDATAASYVVQGLSAGTYYFAVSAYNTLGLESPFSNIASKTL